MTGRRAGTTPNPSCPPSTGLLPPPPPSCPGLSRAPTPARAIAGSSDRARAVRGPVRLGTAWVAGTSPAMTGWRAGTASDPSGPPSADLPHPLHRHARACPGHPRRPAPSRVLGPGRGRPGLGAARHGVGGRDKPGHDGTEGGDHSESITRSLDRSPAPLRRQARACPRHSRRPAPPAPPFHGAANRPHDLRPPSSSPRWRRAGAGSRACPRVGPRGGRTPARRRRACRGAPWRSSAGPG